MAQNWMFDYYSLANTNISVFLKQKPSNEKDKQKVIKEKKK